MALGCSVSAVCSPPPMPVQEMKVLLSLLLRRGTWSVAAGHRIFRTAETTLPFVPKKGDDTIRMHPAPL